MKYKTLFRLLLKAFGVMLFAYGIPQVIPTIAWAMDPRTRSLPSNTHTFLQVANIVIQPVLGLYLFFGGKWIVNLAIPGNRPYCPECAYDLTGAPTERCPECGTAFRWEDVRPSSEGSEAARQQGTEAQRHDGTK